MFRRSLMMWGASNLSNVAKVTSPLFVIDTAAAAATVKGHRWDPTASGVVPSFNEDVGLTLGQLNSAAPHSSRKRLVGELTQAACRVTKTVNSQMVRRYALDAQLEEQQQQIVAMIHPEEKLANVPQQDYHVIVVSQSTLTNKKGEGDGADFGPIVGTLSCQEQLRLVQEAHQGALDSEGQESLETWGHGLGVPEAEMTKWLAASTPILTPTPPQGEAPHSPSSTPLSQGKKRGTPSTPALQAEEDPAISLFIILVLYRSPAAAAGAPMTVASGTTFEYYWSHRTTMMTYTAVCPEHRGKGLARKMLDACLATSMEVSSSQALAPQGVTVEGPSKRLLIFVSPPLPHEVDRQTVWSNLGFRPLVGYNFVFPSSTPTGDTYQMVVYRPDVPWEKTTKYEGGGDGSTAVTTRMQKCTKSQHSLFESTEELSAIMKQVFEDDLDGCETVADPLGEIKKEMFLLSNSQLRIGTSPQDWLGKTG